MNDHVVQCDSRIIRLKDQISALRKIDFNRIRPGSLPELAALSRTIICTIEHYFAEDSTSCRRFLAAAALVPPQTESDVSGCALRQALRSNVQRAIALLEDAERMLNGRFAVPHSVAQVTSGAPPRRVLVIHDKDDGAHRRVVRFLEGGGLETVNVSRPSRGETVLGTLEACREAGFAVMLLAPDNADPVRDGVAGLQMRPHALLELGYLMGRLGRAHVCVFTRGMPEVKEEPIGLLWHAMDRAFVWQPVLSRALRLAGYAFECTAISGGRR